MDLEIVAQNDFGVSQYDREKKIIHYKFGGVVQVEKGQEIFNKTLKFSENNKIIGIHADIRGLTGTFSMFDDYFSKDYFPVLSKRGLKCHSMIVSVDIFTKYAAQRLLQKSETHKGIFVMKTFSDVDEGYKWLLENLK